MLDGELYRHLAYSAPTQWTEQTRRLEALTEIEDLASPTLADVKRLAKRVDLSVQTFRRLLDQRAATRIHGVRTDQRMGCSHIDSRMDAVIREALQRPGGRGHMGRVMSAVTAECHRLGLTVPSSNAVRHRLRLSPTREELRRLVGSNVDLVIDDAELDVWVNDHEQLTMIHVILAIEVSTGRVVHHEVAPRVPKDEAFVRTAVTAASLLSWVNRIGATTRGRAALGTKLGPLAKVGLVLDPLRLRTGDAVMVTIGRMLGRIPVRPRRRSSACLAHDAVPLAVARGVVDVLIERHNSCRTEAERASPSEQR